MNPGRFEYGPCDGDAWANESWRCGSRQALKFQSEISELNRSTRFDMMCDLERLSAVSDIYHKLYHLTRRFTAIVHDLVDAALLQAPCRWAEAASLLVSWSVDVLRHDTIGFEKFLLSQRGSIYWVLDDALLRICLDQWENEKPSKTWDKAITPLRLAISRAQASFPEWGDRDCEEARKWESESHYTPSEMTECCFQRSRKFLHQSTKIFELWRTMRLWGKGLLPAELANAIVEDVAKFEELHFGGELRLLFFPESKMKAIAS